MAAQDPAERAGRAPYTVVALFENTLDAGIALQALRREGYDAATVSMIVAVPAKDERPGVARAVLEADLEGIADWVPGLASIVVPDDGMYLVGGPLGAVAAGIGNPPVDVSAADDRLVVDNFERALLDFGFDEDEAGYVDKRLMAGAPLVAVSAIDGPPQVSTRRLLADRDAVYLGTADTPETALVRAAALLTTSAAAGSGQVQLADVVGPLRRVRGDEQFPQYSGLVGRSIVDEAGAECGRIEDVLVEVVDPDGPAGPAPEVRVARYVVAGFGGVLGLGRHRAAIPIDLVDLDAEPARLRVAADVLEHAPRFSDDPFSRRDEHAVNAYFGVPAYWLPTDGEPIASSGAAGAGRGGDRERSGGDGEAVGLAPA